MKHLLETSLRVSRNALSLKYSVNAIRSSSDTGPVSLQARSACANIASHRDLSSEKLRRTPCSNIPAGRNCRRRATDFACRPIRKRSRGVWLDRISSNVPATSSGPGAFSSDARMALRARSRQGSYSTIRCAPTRRLFIMGVLRKPASVSDTQILKGLTSCRKASVYPSRANLLAEYEPRCSRLMVPKIEPMFTIRPQCRRRIAGMTARLSRNGA